jgi:uncharacterized protein
VHTIIEMAYQWNREKAATNLRKHGTIPDERFDEERFITIGIDALGRILVVVYAMRDDEIRLISARQATKQEKQQYEEG